MLFLFFYSLFNKYLLRNFYVSGTILSTRDTVMNKIGKILGQMTLTF